MKSGEEDFFCILRLAFFAVVPKTSNLGNVNFCSLSLSTGTACYWSRWVPSIHLFRSAWELLLCDLHNQRPLSTCVQITTVLGLILHVADLAITVIQVSYLSVFFDGCREEGLLQGLDPTVQLPTSTALVSFRRFIYWRLMSKIGSVQQSLKSIFHSFDWLKIYDSSLRGNTF